MFKKISCLVKLIYLNILLLLINLAKKLLFLAKVSKRITVISKIIFCGLLLAYNSCGYSGTTIDTAWMGNKKNNITDASITSGTDISANDWPVKIAEDIKLGVITLRWSQIPGSAVNLENTGTIQQIYVDQDRFLNFINYGSVTGKDGHFFKYDTKNKRVNISKLFVKAQICRCNDGSNLTDKIKTTPLEDSIRNIENYGYLVGDIYRNHIGVDWSGRKVEVSGKIPPGMVCYLDCGLDGYSLRYTQVDKWAYGKDYDEDNEIEDKDKIANTQVKIHNYATGVMCIPKQSDANSGLIAANGYRYSYEYYDDPYRYNILINDGIIDIVEGTYYAGLFTNNGILKLGFDYNNPKGANNAILEPAMNKSKFVVGENSKIVLYHNTDTVVQSPNTAKTINLIIAKEVSYTNVNGLSPEQLTNHIYGIKPELYFSYFKTLFLFCRNTFKMLLILILKLVV